MDDRRRDRNIHESRVMERRDICLRSIIDADHPALMEIRSDYDAQHMLMAHPATNGSDFEQWIERRTRRTDEIFLIISHAHSSETFGFIQITGIHTLDRYGFLGIAISHKHRGRQIGTASITSLLDNLRTSGHIKKLCLHVRSDNAIARALYARIGFRDVGVLQQHYFDGMAWHDAILSEMILRWD